MAEVKAAVSMQLDHILLESSRPEDLAAFYASVLMTEVEALGEDAWLCSEESRRVLIRAGDAKHLGLSAFRCESLFALGQLRQRFEQHDIELMPSASPLWQAEDDFAVRDPDGNILCFSHGPLAETGKHDFDGLNARLQHVVVATDAIESMVEFYRDVVGFRISDCVEDSEGNLRVCFLRGDCEHHCFAIFAASSKRLDHHCYETGSWDQIRDWADRMAEKEVPIVWGPGRHGPGHNLFFMINDPDGNWLEFSADLELVKADRPAGVWEHSEKTLNQWGKGMIRK